MKLRLITAYLSICFVLSLAHSKHAYSLDEKEYVFAEKNNRAKKFLRRNNIYNTKDIIESLDNITRSDASIWLEVGESYRHKKDDAVQSRAWIIYYHLLLDERMPPIARSMAAVGLSRMSQYKRALCFARQAVDLDKGNGQAYLRLAELQSNFEEKRKNHKIALTLSTINRDQFLRIKVLFRLAHLHERNYELIEARKYRDQAQILLAELNAQKKHRN